MSRLSSVAVTVAALALSACRTAIHPWGGSVEAAKRHADNAFAAFAYRFHNVQRDPRFARARALMGKHALTPSRIFGDTSLWTISNAEERTRALYVQGSYGEGRYLFSARPSAPYPTRLGDQRHFLQLRNVGEDTYEWYTMVDHGIGPVRAGQVADALGAVFTAFDGRPDAELLAEARATFPRTGRHLGQILALDSLRTAPGADGTTTFAMYVSYRVATLRKGYPAFADYVQKYIASSNFRIQLGDRTGARYLDVRQRDAAFVVRLRARNGSLVSLAGPPRPLPDSLLLLADASAKFKIFRVGFSKLVGDFTIERGEHERAWMMRFRKEPDWDFPLAADRLIKTPLRRPFEGRGSEVRLAVRDDLGSQAMSVRQVRTTVRESAIMRWLGSLGASAFGDYEGNTEREENRFMQELFGALRQDFAQYRP